MVKVAAGWLAVLMLADCGGQSTRTVDDSAGAGSGANGGTGNADVGGNGATTANAGMTTGPALGGAGGTATTAPGGKGGASGAVSASGGSTAIDGGVADCNSSRLYCCDRSTGAWVPSDCDASGISSCPSDTTKIEPGGVCAPIGYDVTSCGDLQGQTCPVLLFGCSNAERCSWFCICETPRDSDALMWWCSMHLC
jgi:hypothetical protein